MKKILFTLFTILALFASCKRDDDVYTTGSKNGLDADGLFQVTGTSPAQTEADTASLITISLKISPDADTLSHTIHVSTDLGTFIDGKASTTVMADAGGIAKAYLRSGQIGAAHLTFTDQSLSISTVINFVAALPDDITFIADKYTGDTSTSFMLTTNLFRTPGKGIVSDPVKVTYSILPSAPGASLIIPDFVNSAKGVAGCMVTNPYKITGTFTIEAQAPGDSGDPIKKYIILIIK